MGDRRLSPAYFKAEEPLVATRQLTVLGVELQRGSDIPQDLDLGIRRRLWQTTRAVYKKDFTPTPVESAEDEAARLVTMEGPLPGGYYHINAPWMAEPEKVRGKVPAERRRDEIVAYGDPKGVFVSEAGGGWYHIDAAWLPEAEKVQGKDEAEARADELRAEGAPAGFDPAIAELVKTGDFEATYTFGEAVVSLADIIAAAQSASGHDPAQWAELTDEDRASLIRREIDTRNEALERSAAEPEQTGEVQPNPATERQEAPAADFTAEETGSNGNYTITGPGLDEPIKFRGTAEDLEAKLTELRAGQVKADEPPADEA